MTREEIDGYLQHEAPIPAAMDDFKSVARSVARHLFPHVNAASTVWLLGLMSHQWLPRLSLDNDREALEERLLSIVYAARKRYDVEQAAKAKRDADKEAAAQAVMIRRAVAKRPRKALPLIATVKKIMKAVKVKERRAYQIYHCGTSDLAHAKKIAKVTETEPIAWYSEAATKGREPNLMTYINQKVFHGCTLRDFVRNLDADADTLEEALQDAYIAGRVSQSDFRALDEFRAVARALGFDGTAALSLWDAYQLWRLDRVYQRTRAKLSPKADALDFG